MRVLDELIDVAVAGHDDHVLAAVADLGGEGGDDVVGLEPGLLEERESEDLDDLADQAHLLAQDVGSGLATGLVVVEPFVPERRLGPIEGHGHAVGTVVAEQVEQHRREAVDGVGHLARCGRQIGGQREERSVGERVAVDQQVLARSGVGHVSWRGFARQR